MSGFIFKGLAFLFLSLSLPLYANETEKDAELLKGEFQVVEDSASNRKFAIVGRIDFPLGVGPEVTIHILKPLTVSAAYLTNTYTNAINAGVGLRLFPLFGVDSSVSPLVQVEYSRITFTSNADAAIKEYAKDYELFLILTQQEPPKIEGTQMSTVSYSAGIDYKNEDGFYLALTAGQIQQVGEIKTDDDRIREQLEGLKFFTGSLRIGYFIW